MPGPVLALLGLFIVAAVTGIFIGDGLLMVVAVTAAAFTVAIRRSGARRVERLEQGQ